jgi:hypothetical protein
LGTSYIHRFFFLENLTFLMFHVYFMQTLSHAHTCTHAHTHTHTHTLHTHTTHAHTHTHTHYTHTHTHAHPHWHTHTVTHIFPRHRMEWIRWQVACVYNNITPRVRAKPKTNNRIKPLKNIQLKQKIIKNLNNYTSQRNVNKLFFFFTVRFIYIALF